VLDGHFYLWLPPAIGQPVVASFTLVFLFMVISGLILWWPRKKKNLKSSITIKWNARWRRKNYDLHQVMGFYVMGFASIFAITGLVWGFVWFRDAVFFVSSGGEDYVEYYTPLSDSIAVYQDSIPALDAVWMKMRSMYPNAEWIEVHPPEFENAAIAANANPDASTYWKMDYRYFDQNTLEELPVEHIYNRFEEASIGDKVMRINYDLHVGAIAGLPGKIFAFLLSAIIGSLPITGTLIWWGRKKKAKRENSGHTSLPEQEEK
tara:strand:- start:148 stop:936 length:789 start_codon:yes stop_codon:yes gene_type:complete